MSVSPETTISPPTARVNVSARNAVLVLLV